MLSRREFLAVGLGAVAWACGGGKTKQAATPQLNLTPVTTELALGDRRMAFALLTNDQKPYDPEGLKSVRVELRRPDGKVTELQSTPVSIRFGGGEAHEDEGAEIHDIFSVRTAFDAVGLWQLRAHVGDRAPALPMQVLDRSETVMVGAKAIPSQSPTTSDPRGVNPICTRTPPCSMHDRTIADALGMNKPTMITFATPRFCTSRVCGPLMNVIEGIKAKIGDRASFVHVEIWKDDKTIGQEGAQAPVVSEWKLPADPFLFFVAPDGVIKDRWSGPAGGSEIQSAMDALIAGTL